VADGSKHQEPPTDLVILHARKGGASEALHLPRPTAEERADALEADGWICQIVEYHA
jgi:hypothetical protein